MTILAEILLLWKLKEMLILELYSVSCTFNHATHIYYLILTNNTLLRLTLTKCSNVSVPIITSDSLDQHNWDWHCTERQYLQQVYFCMVLHVMLDHLSCTIMAAHIIRMRAVHNEVFILIWCKIILFPWNPIHSRLDVRIPEGAAMLFLYSSWPRSRLSPRMLINEGA